MAGHVITKLDKNICKVQQHLKLHHVWLLLVRTAWLIEMKPNLLQGLVWLSNNNGCKVSTCYQKKKFKI